MGTPHPEATRPGPPRQPVTLLESFSPYGSRKVTVEYDGMTTAAYLHDDTAAISATWIANHRPAPSSADQARLDAGRAPLMPAGRTKHPGGRPPLRASALEALWFEEGDGAAIYENGRPIAVIAGWSDMDRGMPGYSSDVIGQTPFGWSLDDAMEGLAPRLERSRAYWRWRQSGSGWGQFQQALLGHLLPRLGPGGHYWDASAGNQPLTGVTERPLGVPPSVHGPVHRGHELPADAGRGAGPGRPERVRADRARARHDAAQRAGGPSVPVAGDVPVARGDLVRAWPQRPLVSRAVDVPARRRRGGPAARLPRHAARTRAARPVGLRVRRGPGPLAMDRPDLRTGPAAGQGTTAPLTWSAGSPRSSEAGSRGRRSVLVVAGPRPPRAVR